MKVEVEVEQVAPQKVMSYGLKLLIQFSLH